ncbi:MAG: hypothetical protein P1V97_13500 [Planctomycetota bacterium]|nr:hypothetical protein [Planctomycetota bacterium]
MKRKRVVEDPFLKMNERKEKEIYEGFGKTYQPSTRLSLLHYKKAEKIKSTELKSRDTSVPILLVHGAMVNGPMSWADNAYHTPGRQGLATFLSRQGYHVFVITFSHPHGDNDYQAEHIGIALARIRQRLKVAKVDVLAHSKGTIAAQMYASDVRAKLTKPRKFAKDIGRLILVGGGLGGIDINFAYPNLNYLIIAQKFNAPVIWSKAMVHGSWLSFGKQSIAEPGTAFRGQAQLLARWDHIYGLIRIKGQYDIGPCYSGRAGTVSNSPGIDKAIQFGGHVIAKLHKKGVHKSVEVALLAGTHYRIIGYLGERRGPSDGVVLTRSALMSRAVTARKAKVIRRSSLTLNHLELTYDSKAFDWILETIRR